MITPKDEDFVFLVADGSAKLSGRDYEFQEPTLRRVSTVRRENFSGESHGDREDFQPEETKDDEGISKDFWAHAEARKDHKRLFKEISFFVIILNREFNFSCREQNHLLFH